MKRTEEWPSAPGSIEAPPARPDDAKQTGKPADYLDGEERCEFCQHFEEFKSPSCTKFQFEAEPFGHCGAFQAVKEEMEEASGKETPDHEMMESEEEEETE